MVVVMGPWGNQSKKRCLKMKMHLCNLKISVNSTPNKHCWKGRGCFGVPTFHERGRLGLWHDFSFPNLQTLILGQRIDSTTRGPQHGSPWPQMRELTALREEYIVSSTHLLYIITRVRSRIERSLKEIYSNVSVMRGGISKLPSQYRWT